MARSRAPAPAPAPVADHPADAAIRDKSPDALPLEQHAGYAAIVAAFAHYERGRDDEARAELQSIGLQSPFLEWRILLRGLMAYSTRDSARAVENWQRLSANRLPARLAAPFRAAIDPAYRQAQPAATQTQLDTQAQRLAADPVLEGLRAARTAIGRGRSLDAAFHALTPLVPILRARTPQMVPRLARVMYHTILRHGEPKDLPRYLKLFGPPMDDPKFERLQALAYEEGQHPNEASRHWAAYELWLAKNPLGWPAELLAHARAQALLRAARLAAHDRDSRPRTVPRMKLPGDGPEPEDLWRKAAQLLPNWEVPTAEIVHFFRVHGVPADAEQLGRDYLARVPDSLAVLSILAKVAADAGRPAEAVPLFERMLAVNPLDRGLRTQLGAAHLAAARKALVAGQTDAAANHLAAAQSFAGGVTSASHLIAAAVLAHAINRPADAATLVARADEVPHRRGANRLELAALLQLAKVKPAARTASNKELVAVWGQACHPTEVLNLQESYDALLGERIDYRGAKAQLGKIGALFPLCADADAPDDAFAKLLADYGVAPHAKPAAKLLELLAKRFPESPLIAFHQLLARSAVARPNFFQLLGLQAKIAELLKKNPDPKYDEVRRKMAEIRANSPLNIFGEMP